MKQPVDIGNYVLVGVHKKARIYTYHKRLNEITWWSTVNHRCGKTELPKGNYEIVGFGKDLTEEQWKEIVDCEVFPEDVVLYVYYDGEDDATLFLDTATESGHSLIKHHGLENPLILKKL